MHIPFSPSLSGTKVSEALRIRDDERRRVAAELHDGLCQELIASSFAAKALERLLQKEGHPLASQAGMIAKSISESASHSRQIAHGMNPVMASREGLIEALRELTTVTAERQRHLYCSFDCPAPVSIRNPVVANHLYRIAQEAIQNAVRHSNATRIEVELHQTGPRLLFRVADNGCGLSTDKLKGCSFGLRSLRYRAALIQGHLTIRNREGGGTEVSCRIPKR